MKLTKNTHKPLALLFMVLLPSLASANPDVFGAVRRAPMAAALIAETQSKGGSCIDNFLDFEDSRTNFWLSILCNYPVSNEELGGSTTDIRATGIVNGNEVQVTSVTIKR